jgi:hypothetical protein
VRRKDKLRRTSALSIGHFVEHKNREIGVTFDMMYHRGYPPTRHDPPEPGHWELLGFQMEHGFDHLEKLVSDKLEDPHFVDELCDLADQQAEGMLERWKYGDI